MLENQGKHCEYRALRARYSATKYAHLEKIRFEKTTKLSDYPLEPLETPEIVNYSEVPKVPHGRKREQTLRGEPLGVVVLAQCAPGTKKTRGTGLSPWSVRRLCVRLRARLPPRRAPTPPRCPWRASRPPGRSPSASWTAWASWRSPRSPRGHSGGRRRCRSCWPRCPP